MDVSKNNLDKSPTTKVSEHTPYGFSMSTTSSFKDIKNKRGVNRGEDCMKEYFKCLKNTQGG